MKELIRAAIVQSKEPIVIITNHLELGVVDPKIVYANPQFEKLTGYSLDEIYDQGPCILFGEKTDLQNIADIKKTISKRVPWEGPVVIYTKTREEFVAYFKIVPIINPVDEIVYYSCFVQNFEQFLTCNNEENCGVLNAFVDSLFEHYDYFQNLSEQIPQGLIRFDNDGKIVYANSETLSKFNLTMGANIYDNICLEDKMFVTKMINKYIPSAKISKITFRIIKEGDLVWTSFSYWPIFKDGVIVGFAGTLADVSQETNLVRQLQTLRKA